MTGYAVQRGAYDTGETYNSLNRFLKKPRDQERKKYKYATWIYRDLEDSIVVQLHNTAIMQYWPDDRIRLNAGGWRTVTTKSRMNEFLPDPWGVYQENNVWYLWRRKLGTHEEKSWTFEDGIVLYPNLTVTGAGPDKKYAESMNKAINAYAREFVKALFDGKVPPPSAGDCWYCSMRDAKRTDAMREVGSGTPMGEGQTDHLLNHVKERYYVPSLLVNALNATPSISAAKQAVRAIWDGDKEGATMWGGDWSRQQIKSSLARYIRRQVGLAS